MRSGGEVQVREELSRPVEHERASLNEGPFHGLRTRGHQRLVRPRLEEVTHDAVEVRLPTRAQSVVGLLRPHRLDAFEDLLATLVTLGVARADRGVGVCLLAFVGEQQGRWEVELLSEFERRLRRADAHGKELDVGLVESWEHVAAQLRRELPAEDSSKVAQEDHHGTLA